MSPDASVPDASSPRQLSAELIDALLARSADVVIVISADGTLAYVSPSTPQMFGYPLGTHLGRQGIELIHPDDRALASESLARRVETDEPRDPLELRVLHADGGWRTVEIIATNQLANPAVQGIVLNIRDVTERRRVQQQLSESERFYRQIVESADEGIWTIDANSVTTFVNRRMAEMLGYCEAEMIGAALADFMDDDGREIAERNLERRRQGISEHHDFKFRRADGTELWAILSAGPLLDDSGEYVGALAMVTDVTERREAGAALHTAELRRQQADAESERRRLEGELARAQRLESLGRLAGGVAHDFNNLIGVIVNYTVLVERRLTPGDPLIEDLRHIQRAAAQAAELTAQLLVFGRDDPDLVEVRFDLNALVSETVRLVDRPFGEAIVIVEDLAPRALEVLTDRGRLGQLLMNALLNARDALPTGGTIRVATSLGDDDRIVLEIVDDGIGMAPEVVRRAFEPYFTTKPLTHGSGLGLSTAFSIVDRAGGTIEIESEVGAGTRLTVTLPQAVDVEANAEAP